MSILLAILGVLWTILKILILVTSIFVALTYLFALKEWRYERLTAQFAGEAPQAPAEITPPRLFLTILLETAVSFLAVILSFLAKRRFAPLAPGAAPGTPILLVHGYGYHQAGWIYLQHKLKRAGLGPIYSLNLGPPFASITHFAAQVGRMAKRIEEETGRSDLILVGHSMGGVVTSYYAQMLAPAGSVKQVIALGSPLRGTRIAALGLGACAIEMLPGSPLLRELNARIAEKPATRFRQVASKLDNMIHPVQNALLDVPPEDRLFLADHGHVMLIFSPVVAAKIIAWITQPTSAPEPPLASVG